jgi:hypothetical protein
LNNQEGDDEAELNDLKEQIYEIGGLIVLTNTICKPRTMMIEHLYTTTTILTVSGTNAHVMFALGTVSSFHKQFMSRVNFTQLR